MVTFPFLFGIMFGDIGHGAVFLVTGIILCLTCDVLRRKAPGMEPILGMRYIFLMMGLFAFYCGLIYNDFMAIPLWLFESCYDITDANQPHHNSTVSNNTHIHAEVHHHV